jgi:hypothetical protein
MIGCVELQERLGKPAFVGEHALSARYLATELVALVYRCGPDNLLMDTSLY